MRANPTVKDKLEWFHRAVNHAQQNQSHFVIDPQENPGEWQSWEAYFRDHLGWMPITMQRVNQHLSRTGKLTMPAQWPEWFDPSYAREAAE